MEVILGAITILKSLGVETGRIIESLLVFFVAFGAFIILSKKYIWPFIIKVVAKFDSIVQSVEKMEVSVKDLNHTMQDHITQTKAGLDAGHERFNRVENELTKIKAHVGLH